METATHLGLTDQLFLCHQSCDNGDTVGLSCSDGFEQPGMTAKLRRFDSILLAQKFQDIQLEGGNCRH